jgi:hypothetical protein
MRAAEAMKRQRLEIPGDWHGRDRFLYALVKKTGFLSVNQLLTHVAYEMRVIKTPAKFYRALAQFHEVARKK